MSLFDETAEPDTSTDPPEEETAPTAPTPETPDETDEEPATPETEPALAVFESMGNELPEGMPKEDDAADESQNELMRNELRNEIDSWRSTFQSEWQLDDADKKSAKVTSDIREQLTSLLDDAITTMAWMVKHCKNDNLKFKSAQYVIDTLLSDKGGVKVDDPLVAFLEEMRTASPPPNSADTPQ